MSDTPFSRMALIFISVLDLFLKWTALICGGATLTFMTGFSVWNVLIMRKAMNAPITGAEDLLLLALVAIVALSIPLGARTGAHIEIEILELINKHRKTVGLNPLEKMSAIKAQAYGHTDYMIEVGSVNHDNFNLRAQNLMNNAGAKKVGENVAYGFSSAKGVVNGWLNSPEHKSIIENPNYTHFGISTESNSEGRNYFTQIFISK